MTLSYRAISTYRVCRTFVCGDMKFINNMIEFGRGGVSKSFMPNGVCNSGDMSLRHESGGAAWKLIKTIRMNSFTQSVFLEFVLNHKRIFIKCNKAIVIFGELMHREKIRVDFGNMKNILKFKRVMRSRENTRASV